MKLSCALLLLVLFLNLGLGTYFANRSSAFWRQACGLRRSEGMPFSQERIFLQPRSPVLSWIADMGSDISEEIRNKLCATLASSTLPAALGSLNSICITLLAYFRLEEPVLLIIALIDSVFLVTRSLATNVRALERIAADMVVLSGIGWAIMLAATMVVVGFSGDTPMIIITVASALGSCAGIIARNYAAPRMALTQVVVIDGSFKIPFGALYPEFIPLLMCQGVGFVSVAAWIMRQQRDTTVRAIAGQIESRTQSLVDPLTGLLNRRGLAEKTQLMRQNSSTKVLLYLDLDGFKQINDRLGHGVGDEILSQVARRLTICMPESPICRMGGDEFIAVVDCQSRHAASAIGSRIIHTLSLPYTTSVGQVSAGVSVGICLFDPASADLERVMMQADAALYQAKSAGRGCALLYGEVEEMPAKVSA